MKTTFCALLISLAIFSPLCLVGQEEASKTPVTAEEVLRAALEARGGSDTFQRIRSFHAKGTVWFYTSKWAAWCAPSVTNAWPLDIFAMRPDKFRVAVDLTSTAGASSQFVPARYFSNGFDGRTAWELLPDGEPNVLQGIFGDERREQAEVFAWQPKSQDFRALTNVGEVSFEGRRCYELKLVRNSGKEETHYYDVNNHLLAGLIRSSVFGPSLERIALNDYRDFGGFLFPTRISYQAEDERDLGRVRAVEQFEFIEINQVNESTFTMPPAAPLVEAQMDSAPSITTGEIQNMLRDWVDRDGIADGMVVGILDRRGQQVVSQGAIHKHIFFIRTENVQLGSWSMHPKISGDTPIPIASITKDFTRLLLLDMIQRGEMRLDDPLQTYVPESVRVPTHNGKQITLLHLATHTSGLPRWVGGDLGCFESVYTALSDFQLTRDPGSAYEYSNVGIDLLGNAIKRKAGKPYSKLIEERICRPLGMRNTSACDNPAGGVQSTANDMLKFAAAGLGFTTSSLAPLIQHEYLTHGGAGGAFASFLAVDRVRCRALFALASDENRYGFLQQTVNQMILHQSFKPLRTVSCDYTHYHNVVGQYLFADNSVWAVRREGERLLFQGTLHPTREMFPVSKTEFVNGMFDFGAEFLPGTNAQSKLLLIHDLARSWQSSGQKISDQTPLRGTGIRLDSKIATGFGQYRDSAGNILILRCEDNGLIAQLKQCGSKVWETEELIPESNTWFRSRIAAAVLTLVPDSGGNMTDLIRHFGDTHTRYARFAPVPGPPTQAQADRFVGVWQAVDTRTNTRIELKIAKRKNSYWASINGIDRRPKNCSFKTLLFLDDASLFLGASFGEARATFTTTLNDSGTEMSGTWRAGSYCFPLTLKKKTEPDFKGQP